MTLLAALAATLILNPAGTVMQPYQTWVNEAHVRTPGGEVTLLLREQGCDNVSDACGSPRRRLIIMPNMIDWYTRAEFLHELGHIYSYEHPHAIRRLFSSVFHTRYDDEWFAMGYAWCALNPMWRSLSLPGYDYAPTRTQHRQLCRGLA